jgi:ketosteroid isomerase-like protein
MHTHRQVLQTYMDALGRGDYATITALFSPDGRVISPFLGEMAAEPFFDRLAEASEQNVITPIDIFLSESGGNHAVAYFQYDWTVRDGTVITFKVMDYFTFAPGSDLVSLLDIIYDTHPIRVEHGNKYDQAL